MKHAQLIRVAARVVKLCGKRFHTAPAVGVDIGSHSIKIVILRKNPASPEGFSANAGEVFLRSDCFKNKEMEDFDSVRSDLSFLCEDFGVKGEKAAVSISGDAVFTSKVKVPQSPADSQEKIREAVLLHLKQFFPEGMSRFRFDFQPPARDSGETLVAVADKDKVDGYAAALSASGFVPAVVDYDGFALINSYTGSARSASPEGVTVLLNVGRSVTNVAVLEGMNPVFTRDLSCGSEELTFAMARAGDLTADEAELAKSSLAGDGSPEFLRIAREFALGVAVEVKSNLEVFLDCVNKKADRVVLSGGGSLVCGFRETVAETLKTEVEYADPLGGFDRVSDKSDADYLRRLSPKAAVAFGLALRMAE